MSQHVLQVRWILEPIRIKTVRTVETHVKHGNRKSKDTFFFSRGRHSTEKWSTEFVATDQIHTYGIAVSLVAVAVLSIRIPRRYRHLQSIPRGMICIPYDRDAPRFSFQDIFNHSVENRAPLYSIRASRVVEG